MIVAVSVVLMVQVTVDEIIDVVAVRNRFVSTVRSVHMCRVVPTTDMTASAGTWIHGAHF